MKYVLFLIAVGVILTSGCDDSGVNQINDTSEILIFEGSTLIPNSSGSSIFADNQRSKTSGLPKIKKEHFDALKEVILTYSNAKKSKHVALLSYKKNSKFKYRYFKLTPNESSLKNANGERLLYYILFIDPVTTEVSKILAAWIPNTPEQKKAIKDWAKKISGRVDGWNQNKNKLQSWSDNQNISNCGYVEDIIVWDEELGSYHQYGGWVCIDQEEKETDQIEDSTDDSSGGSGGCPYAGGGCEEEPIGGGGGPTSPLTCPVGQVEDANGECIDGEVPCVGNPVKNPRIAEQTNSGIEGGRFNVGDDAVRKDEYGNFIDHNGTDFLTSQGEAIFSMHDGQVVRIANDEDGWGNFIVVKHNVNGNIIWTIYAHLESVSIEEGSVTKGTVLGTAGVSGNLADAINDGYAKQHLHLETREDGWTGKDPKDPEIYLKTKFDTNGNAISSTDC